MIARTLELLRGKEGRRGFTLAEMVVAVALMAIITAAVLALIQPTINIYNQTQRTAELSGMLDTLSLELTSALQTIDEPPVIDAGSGTVNLHNADGELTYSLIDGRLYQSVDGGTPYLVMPEAFYRGSTLGLEGVYTPAAADTPALFVLTLTLSTNGDSLSRSYTVKPLILNQQPGA